MAKSQQRSASEVLVDIEKLIHVFRSTFQLPRGLGSKRESLSLLSRMWNGYQNILMAASIRWKHGFGDAFPKLDEANELARSACVAYDAGVRLYGVDFEEGNYFRFGTATLLSAIASANIRDELFDILPNPSRWRDLQTPILVDYLDICLVLQSRGANVSSEFNDILTEVPTDVRKCYNAYANLINMGLDSSKCALLPALLADLDKMFLNRSRDMHGRRYAVWEGGGSLNYLFVDLRLAAVLNILNANSNLETSQYHALLGKHSLLLQSRAD